MGFPLAGLSYDSVIRGYKSLPNYRDYFFTFIFFGNL